MGPRSAFSLAGLSLESKSLCGPLSLYEFSVQWVYTVTVGWVWRRQSSGLPAERRDRHVEDCSRAVGGGVCRVSWLVRAWILRVSLCQVGCSEAVGTVASRFEGAYLSVALGNRIFFLRLF